VNAATSSTPQVSVVVPSHNRPMRLRRLLDALEEQTLARDCWEVIVVHDSPDRETDIILRDHPLAAEGTLRHIRYPPNSASPSLKRNAGWQAAHAALIAFTDDDCRPEPGWLGALLEAAAPDAVVQGATTPDPLEDHLLVTARHARSQRVDPPSWYAQTCNIAYPRSLLERVGGFDELGPVPAGEDTDLYLRVRATTGARLIAASDAVVRHAVEPMTLLELLRFTRRWEQLAAVVKRHPDVRSSIYLRLFWRKRHAHFLLGVFGLLAARRHVALALLVVPWLRLVAPSATPRALVGQLRRAPAEALIDAHEIMTLARGSVRHRTLFL
jgi:glycosyltransferase involved in cell wall biosynthesis